MLCHPICTWLYTISRYGVALVCRIDKIIGLFCKRALQKRQYSAKETYNCIDPTDRSHPIPACGHTRRSRVSLQLNRMWDVANSHVKLAS